MNSAHLKKLPYLDKKIIFIKNKSMRLIRMGSCLSFCLAALTLQLSAQSVPPTDTAVLSAAIRNSGLQYQHFISKAAPLYSGPEYVEYDGRLNEGHPFLLSSSFVKGTIVYDNVSYENVPLKYDLVSNRFVLNDATGTFKLSPDYEKISSFTLGDHFFVKIPRDSSHVLLSGNQFYEVLLNGRSLTLLKKDTKKVQEEISTMLGLRRLVVSSTNFYVRGGNRYSPFNKKSQVLDLFKERKAEIRQFIRQQNLHFDDDERENSLLKIAIYYDSLSK